MIFESFKNFNIKDEFFLSLVEEVGLEPEALFRI